MVWKRTSFSNLCWDLLRSLCHMQQFEVHNSFAKAARGAASGRNEEALTL